MVCTTQCTGNENKIDLYISYLYNTFNFRQYLPLVHERRDSLLLSQVYGVSPQPHVNEQPPKLPVQLVLLLNIPQVSLEVHGLLKSQGHARHARVTEAMRTCK